MKIIYIFLSFISFSSVLFASDNSIYQLIPENELECMKNAYNLLKKKNYEGAVQVAKKCDNSEIKQMVDWHGVNHSLIPEESFSLDFLISNKNFPEYSKLLKNLEKKLALETDPQKVLLFFAENYPSRKEGYEALINAVNTSDDSGYTAERMNEMTKFYFLSNEFKISDFSKFIKQHNNVINQDLINQKITKLIWSRKYKEAEKIIGYTDKERRSLFKVQISFLKNSPRAPRYLNNLPKKSLNNEGLFFNIVKWLERKDRDSRVTKYLMALKPSEYSAKWFGSRMRNARYLIKKQKYEEAYKIISNHNLDAGSYEFAESEWFSGWIALRFLKKPYIAIDHFENFYNNVGFAISVSRGAYWLGRSYLALGNKQMASHWYEIASDYSATYYGQMAILEINNEVMINLPQFNKNPISDLKEFIGNNPIAKIGLYYAYVGRADHAAKFFVNLMLDETQSDIQEKIISLTTYTNDYAIINKVSRYATRFNFITLANYPIIKNIKASEKKQSLIMSIIRQESGFNKSAVSGAGAVGFMQLMPATAKEMSKRMRVSYSKRKLKKDPGYNIMLGTYYINHLLKRFDNSYILSIASYNAGPNNTKRWIKENGDPREFNNVYDIIDWIEKITFSETRNYVQRILETSIIYLHLLKNDKQN